MATIGCKALFLELWRYHLQHALAHFISTVVASASAYVHMKYMAIYDTGNTTRPKITRDVIMLPSLDAQYTQRQVMQLTLQ